jgi:hypothetical protein
MVKRPPAFEYRVEAIVEVNRTKPKIYEGKNRFYFHIKLTDGQRIMMYTLSESETDQWIERLFVSLLYYKTNQTKADETAIEVENPAFPFRKKKAGFTVLEELGHGSYGVVHRAQVRGSDNIVALK